MTVVGNDNQRTFAAVLGTGPKKFAWMTGYTAQLMVFLNGLILTVTAFITLNIFIDQIIHEKISSITYESQEYLNEKIASLQKSILTAGSIIAFSHDLKVADITDNFGKFFFDENDFSQIYWLEYSSDGQYLAHKLLKNRAESSDPGKNLPLHQFVVKNISGKDDIQFFQDYKGFNVAKDESTPLIVAKKITGADNKNDIIYGVTRLGQLVNAEFFDYRTNIQKLDITASDNQTELYQYVRSGAPVNFDTADLFKNTADLSLAAQNIKLAIWINLGERELFLQKIPLLTFLFGATLTLIGTLYVRNNQKQSVRLATMNMELAQKNEKLNHEVIEREKLNQTLRKQEKDNRAVIDAVSDIIFETSTDGQILFLNETWQKITGFSSERSVGRNLFDLLYMQDQAEQRSNMAQLVKGKKQAYRAFTRLRAADGTFRAVELAVSMLRQDESKDLRVVGTITDVEERRRAERALSEAEKKYRAIVENAASGIYQVTPEGVYLSANPAMAHILGYESPDEILRDIRNANTDIYFNARERERHLRDSVRGSNVNVECQIRRKNGEIVWVQESLRAVKDDEDQLLFFEGSMENITARKDTEIALREAKIMSDLANRAKSEFLANMSHELRTPLNAVIGFSDIISTQAFGAVGRPEYLDYARDINESGKRLLQVINDILDVSRIEAGDRQLNEGMVDLNKIVQSGLEMMGQKIDLHKTIISNYVTEGTPKLIGEAQAVKQMIMNLLSNAIKFTPEGGRVSIYADVDDYGQMHISVTDTGMGLSDEEIEKALSPFGQVNASLNKSESGTGLGLTLVQSLMALHGGTFELFSQKGVGTTASLIFPAKRVSLSSRKDPVTV